MVRRCLSIALRVLTVVVASAAVALVLVIALLASGPISLERLTPYIEAALTPEDGAFRFEVGETAMRFSRERGIALVALDARGLGPADELLFELPELEVDLDLEALLLEWVIAPTRLDARAPTLILARNEEGQFGLATRARDPQDRTSALDLATLVAPLLTERDPDVPLSYLETLRVSGGQLVLEDRITGTAVEASHAELLLGREGGALRGQLDFRIARPGDAVEVSLSGRYGARASRIGYELAFSGLTPDDVEALVPDAPVRGLDLRLAGTLSGAVTLEGDFLPLTVELQSAGGSVDLPEHFAPPIALDRLQLEGRLDPAALRLDVQALELSAHGTRLQMAGEAAWGDRGMAVQAEIEAEQVGIDDLATFWPTSFGDQARSWVLENVSSGRAPRGRAEIRIEPGDLRQRPLPRGLVTGWFEFEDVTVRYLGSFPPIAGIGGRATFDGQTMDFTGTGGRLDGITLESGTATISGIGIPGRHTTQLEVVAEASGPARQALALLEREPLGFPSQLGIDPAAVSGSARATLRFGLPLYGEVRPDELRVAAEASVGEAAIADLFGTVDLAQGSFDLEVDREGLNLAGDALVQQLPLAIEWRENFEDQSDVRRRYRLAGTIEAARLQALGDMPPLPGLEGSLNAVVTGVQRGAVQQIDAVLDLAALGVAVPRLGWRKPPGTPGGLEATLDVPAEGPIRVADFQLDAAGLNAGGSLEVERAPYALRTLALDRLNLDDQQLSGIVRRENGAYRAQLIAQSLDLTPLLRGRDEDNHEPLPTFEIDLKADRVLYDGRTFTSVMARLARERGIWRSGELTALLPEGGRLEGTLVPEDGVQQLSIASSDAGHLLQGLDQTNGVRGGRLSFDMTVAAQEPDLQGQARLLIEQFTLLDAPVLAQLLTLASFQGIGNLLEGDGIDFDRLEAPFRIEGDVITLERGRMSGSELGLTFEGTIDLESGRLDLNGTAAPIYTINRIIGSIPVIGDFLSGSEGEGAFAATFTISGQSDDPQVVVNPLSVLAPGFIRELFSGIREGTTEAPTLPGDTR